MGLVYLFIGISVSQEFEISQSSPSLKFTKSPTFPTKDVLSEKAEFDLLSNVQSIRDVLDAKYQSVANFERLAHKLEYYLKTVKPHSFKSSSSSSSSSSLSVDAFHEVKSAVSFERNENIRLNVNVKHLQSRLDRFHIENQQLMKELAKKSRRIREVKEETNILCSQLRHSLEQLALNKKRMEQNYLEERTILTESLRDTLETLADENQSLRLKLYEHEHCFDDRVRLDIAPVPKHETEPSSNSVLSTLSHLEHSKESPLRGFSRDEPPPLRVVSLPDERPPSRVLASPDERPCGPRTTPFLTFPSSSDERSNAVEIPSKSHLSPRFKQDDDVYVDQLRSDGWFSWFGWN